MEINEKIEIMQKFALKGTRAQTNEQMKVPCVLPDFVPLGDAAHKDQPGIWAEAVMQKLLVRKKVEVTKFPSVRSIVFAFLHFHFFLKINIFH